MHVGFLFVSELDTTLMKIIYLKLSPISSIYIIAASNITLTVKIIRLVHHINFLSKKFVQLSRRIILKVAVCTDDVMFYGISHISFESSDMLDFSAKVFEDI